MKLEQSVPKRRNGKFKHRESPKRKNTAFKRQKFAIQNNSVHCSKAGFGISGIGQK